MVQYLTPDEIKARVDRADLEARTARELALIEHCMESLARKAEQRDKRDNDLHEMIWQLIQRLKKG
jgi:hypothetical protein